MRFLLATDVKVMIRRGILNAIFDECDQYDHDETGGRLVGRVIGNRTSSLVLHVDGLIPAGPGTKRSSVSLFQDGQYQERAFRSIENQHPGIRPLGSWHTHHVNGYPELSGGDVATYERTVNHRQHPIDCFYALLVTRRTGGSGRYNVRHYLMRRGEGSKVYEIGPDQIEVVDKPFLTPRLPAGLRGEKSVAENNVTPTALKLAQDNRVLCQLYPGLKSFRSRELGVVYWRGDVEVVDGTNVSVLILESGDGVYTAKLGGNAYESNSPWMAVYIGLRTHMQQRLLEFYTPKKHQDHHEEH